MSSLLQTVTFTAMSYGPAAIAKSASGRPIFVNGAIVGETAQVRLTDTEKKVQTGEILSILTPSPARVPHPCGTASGCACSYGHIAYSEQVQIKQTVFADQLARLANLSAPSLPDISADPKQASRWQLTVNVAEDGSLHLPHNPTQPISHCANLHPTLSQLLAELNLAQPAPPPADSPFRPAEPDGESESVPISPEPLLRALTLACNATGDCFLLLHPTGENLPELRVESGISVVVYRADGNLLCLAGDERLGLWLDERWWQVCPDSQFLLQPSRWQELARQIAAWFQPTGGGGLLEVGADAGLLTAELAGATKEVLALVRNPAYARDFITNLDTFNNVSLFEADYAESLAYLANEKRFFSGAVVQVPAEGLSVNELQQLQTLRPPQLVLYSAQIARLIRTAQSFCQSGWQLSASQVLDHLPNTHEFVGILYLTLAQ
jgi:23S rRNA (uracil1939-C5)-methyltransferase